MRLIIVRWIEARQRRQAFRRSRALRESPRTYSIKVGVTCSAMMCLRWVGGNMEKRPGASAVAPARRRLASTSLMAGMAVAAVLPTSSAMGARVHAPAEQRRDLAPSLAMAPLQRSATSQLGGALAISGGTALVGNWDADGNRGAAYVFVDSGKGWHRQAVLADPGGKKWDGFGYSIAVTDAASGTYAVVSAENGNNGPDRAYIYQRVGRAWHRRRTLTDPHPSDNDGFGASVAMSGATAVVSSYDQQAGRAVAYVYQRSGESWRLQATLLTPPSNSPGEVAISGNYVIFGDGFNATPTIAPGTTSGSARTAAYIFVRVGHKWHRQATLVDPGNQGPDYGAAVALWGNIALVGAAGGPSSSGQGLTFVFQRTGSRWRQQAKLRDPARKDGDNFGTAVAIWKDTAVIGAPYANLCGVAYAFRKSRGKWSEIAKLVQPGPAKCKALDLFGWSVAAFGTTALVSAPYEGETYLLPLP